jgi:hypothetical protein
MMRWLKAASFLWLASIPAKVSAQFLALTSDPTSAFNADGCFAVTSPQIVEVYLVTEGYQGMTGVAFKLNSEPSPNVVPMGFTPANGVLVIGSPESGVAIAMGACYSSAFLLGTLTYQVTPPVSCHKIQMVGNPECGDKPTYTDCSFIERDVNYHHAFFTSGTEVCATSPPPTPVYPEDGATGVPVAGVNLQWDIESPDICYIMPLHNQLATFWFGTDPDPPKVLNDAWTYPTGVLEPATTYYWHVSVAQLGAVGVGPVWSFTTAATTPVEETTWGRVKALFR